MQLSLFYFADEGGDTDRYRLLLEGARFADRNGFAAVWTPERHFHSFGGLYPNPAVTGAAVAAVTHRVAVRAGSVVAPLHDPLRIAEEWSVVDNLSGGRAGVSFASGWHARDFALRPGAYAERHRLLARTVEDVRRLWRGEELSRVDGQGAEVGVRMYPRPTQDDLPVWLTSSGNPDTFRLAGSLGAGLLTHTVHQDADDLARKIEIYRDAYTGVGRGHVTLMLHTFLGPDGDEAREIAAEPMRAYLAGSLDLNARDRRLSQAAADGLVDRGLARYLDDGALFGTPEEALPLLRRLDAAGVDEVACLIDFGVPAQTALDGLKYLDELRQAVAS